jgi:hypothetical protein
MDVCLVLGPRRDQSPRPLRETDAAPVFSTTKARREKWLSRLNSKAFILTVYASPRRLPEQDARLVSGCGPRSAGWDWLPTGFQRKVSKLLLTSHPPFPGFAWRNENASLAGLLRLATAFPWRTVSAESSALHPSCSLKSSPPFRQVQGLRRPLPAAPERADAGRTTARGSSQLVELRAPHVEPEHVDVAVLADGPDQLALGVVHQAH